MHTCSYVVIYTCKLLFSENKTKYRLKWNGDETILEYFENTSYTFNEEMSELDPKETNISTVNLPLIVRNIICRSFVICVVHVCTLFTE